MMKGLILVLGMLSLVISASAVAEISLKVECGKPDGWRISSERTAEGGAGREVHVIRLERDEPAVPPRFDAFFVVEPRGAHSVWVPIYEESERHRLYASEWGKTRYVSEIAKNEPICCAFGEDNDNSLTIACSEAMRHVEYAITVHSTDAALEGRFRFFAKSEAPISKYEVKILVDRRKVFWAKAVSEASQWISKSAALSPCRVPEAAFDPLYSSWYAFWQDVHDDEIVAEAKAAAELGMKSMILDDGWQKVKSKTFYSATGDWEPVKSRFPDMRRHVDKVHAAGIKNYMLWLSVPFVGNESKAYQRFRGKFVAGDGGDTACLDPRFPEVREYLVGIYEKCVRDWDFDGLKLDFIDSISVWSGEDPAIAQNYAGRDCRTLPEGIDKLMTEARRRVTAIKPEALIEFRQKYTGPAIRRYGNMLRATDCPYDLVGNRKRIADLRLTSGTTAVHSDMLVWSPEDSVEDAGRVILNAIFGTVQYSMKLATIPPRHREEIAKWIKFTEAHRETLLKGEFRPYHPELMYPVIEAESASEKIVAVYADGQIVMPSPSKRTILINATAKPYIFVDYGDVGVKKIDCPVSGYRAL